VVRFGVAREIRKHTSLGQRRWRVSDKYSILLKIDYCELKISPFGKMKNYELLLADN
jgi:hypothetical protein